MDNKIELLRQEIKERLSKTGSLADLDKIRVEFLGKKGSITALLKNMKSLSNEEKKTFGAEVNKLKGYAAQRIDERIEELKKKYPSGKFTFKKKRVRYDDDYGGFREMPDE